MIFLCCDLLMFLLPGLALLLMSACLHLVAERQTSGA